MLVECGLGGGGPAFPLCDLHCLKNEDEKMWGLEWVERWAKEERGI